MQRKVQLRTWFRDNYSTSTRLSLSTFLILILVIQNFILLPSVLAASESTSPFVLPSSPDSVVRKNVPIVFPGDIATQVTEPIIDSNSLGGSIKELYQYCQARMHCLRKMEIWVDPNNNNQ